MYIWIVILFLIFGNNKLKVDLYFVIISVLFKKKFRRFVNE